MSKKLIVSYAVFDSRYLQDPERATLLEDCSTLAEAVEAKDDYGKGNVIVKVVCAHIKGNTYEVISQEVVKH
jgi:hypothetical protein